MYPPMFHAIELIHVRENIPLTKFRLAFSGFYSMDLDSLLFIHENPFLKDVNGTNA